MRAQALHSFWSKLGFRALYLRQTSSEVTGENTAIMIKALASEELENKVRGGVLRGQVPGEHRSLQGCRSASATRR